MEVNKPGNKLYKPNTEMNTEYVVRYHNIPENDKTLESLDLCAKFLNLTKFNKFMYESTDHKLALLYYNDQCTVELHYFGDFSYFIKEVSKIANNIFMK